MRKKILFFLIISILILGGVGFWKFLSKKETPYEIFEVKKGEIVQEVSETGQVQTGEKINLGFENGGRIEKIYVKIGDKVKKGDLLAKLETDQLFIELKKAKASLNLAKSQLKKLLAGATKEEIELAQTQVENAWISLQNAQKNLENVQKKAQQDLNQAYENALTTIQSAVPLVETVFSKLDYLQKTYFIFDDQESITVKNKKETVKQTLQQIKQKTSTLTTDSPSQIEDALEFLKFSLNNLLNDIDVVYQITQTADYQNKIPQTEKDSLLSQKTNLTKTLQQILGAIQSINSTKIINKTKIDLAQAKVLEAQGQFEKAQDNLNLIKAKPRDVDIAVYEAKIEEAQAYVNLLKTKIDKCYLRSPLDGEVIDVLKKEGETVHPGFEDTVFTLLPSSPYQIKVDIYEEDIVKVKIGDPVKINLVAFPEKTFKGKVVSINPAEKLIEGVVYYEVKIDFENPPKGIKPGMTSDITIEVSKKENVLTVPENAIFEKNGKNFVKVLKDNHWEEREVKVGIKGSEGMVEVIQGLKEGEKVIIE